MSRSLPVFFLGEDHLGWQTGPVCSNILFERWGMMFQGRKAKGRDFFVVLGDPLDRAYNFRGHGGNGGFLATLSGEGDSQKMTGSAVADAGRSRQG